MSLVPRFRLHRWGHLSREVWPRLPGTLSHAPLVLLVNRSTASASEVLAGAMHDNGRCHPKGSGPLDPFFWAALHADSRRSSMLTV